MDLVGSLLGGDSDGDCGLLTPSPADMEAFDATVAFQTDAAPLQSSTEQTSAIDTIGGEELWEFPDADIMSSVPSDQLDLDSLGATIPNGIDTGTDQDGSPSQVEDAMALAEALMAPDYTQFETFCLAPNVVQQERQQQQQQAQVGDGNVHQLVQPHQEEHQLRPQMQLSGRQTGVHHEQPDGHQQARAGVDSVQSLPHPTIESVKRETQVQRDDSVRLVSRDEAAASGDLAMQENRHPARANAKAPIGRRKSNQSHGKTPESKVLEPTSPGTPAFLKGEEHAVDDESSGSSMVGKPRDRSTQRKLRNKESARRYREKQVAKRRQLENFTRSLAEQNRELETLHEKLVSLTCGHAPVTRTTQITAGPLQDLNQDLRR